MHRGSSFCLFVDSFINFTTVNDSFQKGDVLQSQYASVVGVGYIYVSVLFFRCCRPFGALHSRNTCAHSKSRTTFFL
jgi:hypothetical protein